MAKTPDRLSPGLPIAPSLCVKCLNSHHLVTTGVDGDLAHSGDKGPKSIVPLSSIPPAVPFERRRARRIQLQLAIELEMGGDKRIGRIVELSRTGARITTDGAQAGNSVILRRAGVEVHGQVVWTNGSLAGLRFPVPIDEAHFVQLRKKTID